MRLLLPTIAACLALAQSQFDAVSIKPTSLPPEAASGIATGNGRLDASNVTLKRAIVGAYGVRPSQIIGGPDWLDTDRFEILAQSPDPLGDADLMLLLQGVLAERFHLALHHEQRKSKVYLLEVLKQGSTMKPAAGEEPVTNSSHGRLDAANITMDRFSEVLSRQTDLPVLNRTALKGGFNFTLQWTPFGDNTAELPADAPPTIYTAIQEQLGLRLRSGTAMLDVLAIDRAEHPTPN